MVISWSYGLEDIFKLNYGPQTVGHILNGKAVSCAIRTHFLLEAALMIKLSHFIVPSSYKVLENNSTCDISSNPDEFLLEQDIKEMRSICDTVEQNKIDMMDCSILEYKSVQNLDSFLPKLKTRLSSESRTATLWIHYMQSNDTDKYEFNNEDE